MTEKSLTVAEAGIADQVERSIEPLSETFVADLRAVGTALFHLSNELEPEDANMASWCSRMIRENASVIESVVSDLRRIRSL